MKLKFLLILIVFLAGCVPGLSAVATRDGRNVTIAVSSPDPIYETRVLAIGATSTDERCLPLGDNAVQCDLGTFQGETTIIVTGEVGQVSCHVSGFGTSARQDPKFVPCSVNAP